MKNKIILLMMLLGAIAFNGCPDEEPIKPDPCAGVVETSADFTMKEIIVDTLRMETDTIYTGNTVEFSAKHDADEYQWNIGYDDRTWTTKKITLNFKGFIGAIDVRMIAKRKIINKECAPNDDGIDTVVKKLVVVNHSKMFGDFRGVSTINPLDTFIVTVKRFGEPPEDWRWVSIINLVNGCIDTTSDIIGIYEVRILGYKAYFFRSAHSSEDRCLYPDGLAVLSPDDNHLSVSYSLRDTTYPRNTFPIKFKNYTFKGTRL